MQISYRTIFFVRPWVEVTWRRSIRVKRSSYLRLPKLEALELRFVGGVIVCWIFWWCLGLDADTATIRNRQAEYL